MKKDVKVYFEVTQDDGNQFGMCITLGETTQEKYDSAGGYAALTKSIDVAGVIRLACLDSIGVTPEMVKVISESEYAENYSDQEEQP